MSNFGNRLRQTREQAGFTQEQLAEQIGVTRQAISRWEQGITQPDMQMLVTLSQVLLVDAEFLTFGKCRNTYPQFQKKHKVCTIAAFSCEVIILLLMLFLDPYLKGLVHTYDFDSFLYFWLFRLLLPAIACFTLGFGAAAFLSLFYNTCLGRRWRVTALVLGLVTIAPSLLVVIDAALGIWIPGHSVHITFALYMRTTSLPAVQALLYALLPIVSGVSIFLGFQKRSE